MIILVDTREQRPLKLSLPNKKHKLNYGDYGLMLGPGRMGNTVFERKSIGDLFGTLSKGYGRFKREMERAKGDNVRLVILIEGTMRQVANGYFHSRRPGESIIWQLETIKDRHGVHHKFFQNRTQMALYIEQYFSFQYGEWKKAKGWKRIYKKGAGCYAKDQKASENG